MEKHLLLAIVLCSQLANAADVGEFSVLVERGITLQRELKREEALVVFDDVIKRVPAAQSSDMAELRNKAIVQRYSVLEREKSIERFNPAEMIQYARALVETAHTKLIESQLDEARVYFDTTVTRFEAATEPGLEEFVAAAMVGKGIVLAGQHKRAESIIAFDEVVERFGKMSAPEVLAQVIEAQIEKADGLRNQSKPKEALVLVESLLKRFGTSTKPAMQTAIVHAMVEKGLVLRGLNQEAKALAAYDSAMKRFAKLTTPSIQVHVIEAALRGSDIQRFYSKLDEGLARLDEVVQQFGTSTHISVVLKVADALSTQGWILNAKSNPKRNANASIKKYDGAAVLLSPFQSPARKAPIVQATFDSGHVFSDDDIHLRAIERYDAALSAFPNSTDTRVQRVYKQCLFFKGMALDRLGKADEMIANYAQTYALLGQSTDESLEKDAMAALKEKGALEMKQQKYADAIFSLSTFVLAASQATSEDENRPNAIASALGKMGSAQAKLGKPTEALATYREVIARFKDSKDDTVRFAVALTYVDIGQLHFAQEKYEASIAAYDEFVAIYGNDPEMQQPLIAVSAGRIAAEMALSSEKLADKIRR
jgi:tetratricopeptide (TPR) repeat protein